MSFLREENLCSRGTEIRKFGRMGNQDTEKLEIKTHILFLNFLLVNLLHCVIKRSLAPYLESSGSMGLLKYRALDLDLI